MSPIRVSKNIRIGSSTGYFKFENPRNNFELWNPLDKRQQAREK
jgi:hypothetical protein